MTRIGKWVLLLAASVFAQWNAPKVGSFAVATIRDEAIVSRLRDRFKASGTPVFLMGNPAGGLQQGDMIRFQDKAVLIGADVWQTLAAEGALKALEQAPLVRVKAGADPTAWLGRSRLISNPREKRLYEFGASLLKVLEASIGDPGDGQKLFLSFEGGQMVLTAPASFMDRLRIGGAAEPTATKEKPIAHGRPFWVSRPPPESLVVGSRLDWTAWAVDDSGGPTSGYDYQVNGPVPDGLTWNPTRHVLEGTIAKQGSWQTVFQVKDSKGVSKNLVWKLTVVAAAPVKETPDPESGFAPGLELPWDTLTESRWYSWKLEDEVARWANFGTTLDSVTSDIAVTNWDGKQFLARPRRSGVATFVFHLNRNGTTTVVARSCPVRPHPRPVFLSRNGGSDVIEGSSRTYRPVARDGYGGAVSIEADFPLDAPFEWDGTELRVTPRNPGSWSAKFTARDTLDNVAEQWVSYHAPAKLVSRWSIESRWVAGANTWAIQGELGKGRFGLFTPHPDRLMKWNSPLEQDWPFVVLGANLLGVDAIRHGHAFSIDIGGNLRMPDPALLTGGVFGRVQTRIDARPKLPWIFEGEFLGWVHQAIMATDTSRLRKIIDSRGRDIDADELRNEYGPVLGQVLHDAFDRHNAVFLTRLEGWLQLPGDLYLGMGCWREDLPVRMHLEQRISTGVRWSPEGRFGNLEATSRLGWGPAGVGVAGWWDLKWSSGILP